MARNELERACNYFTLMRLLGGSLKKLKAAWQHLGATVDLTKPLPDNPDALQMLGLRAKDARDTYSRVRNALCRLRPDDQLFERGHHGYPRLLAPTGDAPEFLFVRGDANLLGRPAIAVVGTRHPTNEGVARAKKLGYLLAKKGVVVVSGLARGIDRAAHEGCLMAGGKTVAVIGTPLDTVYPREHAQLQELISEVGAVVSQFCPGTPVQKHFFPMRNATMSGICLGTVVVEASETSGALIQARKALQQGRKLFIPQSAVGNPRLSWPRKFQDKGAVVFGTIEELMGALDRGALLPSEQFGAPGCGAEVWASAEEIEVHVR